VVVAVAVLQDKLGKERAFRTAPLRGAGKPRVDRERKILFGVAVATKGVVKDERCEFDDKTLDQMLALGNAQKRGLKARYTHPNMSNDGMGTLLGRHKDFRLDGDVLRADLHLSPRAFDSPKGDLGTYVMNMAESDPDMFGTSVVIPEWKAEYRLNDDGTRQRKENGDSLPPLCRVSQMTACDAVDSPAANNGFFSDADPAAVATALIDRLFGELDADEVRERLTNFCDTYLATREGQMSTETNTQNTGGASGTQAETQVTETKAAEHSTQETTTAAATQTQTDPPAKDFAALERERCTQIFAICSQAGINSKKAQEFAANPAMTVEKVRQEAFDHLVRHNKPAGDDAGSSSHGESDAVAKDKREYAANKKIYDEYGLTEEQFLKSQEIERNGGLIPHSMIGR
jgi:hypothetical protein